MKDVDTEEFRWSNDTGPDFDPVQWANDVTTTPSANKAYNEYLKTGGKKTFAQWVDEANKSGLLNKILDFGTKLIGNKGGASTGGGGYTPPAPVGGSPAPSTKILGMPPALAGVVGVLVLAGVIYGIYRIAK